jgi:serine/threonine-protein kinase
MNDNEFLRRALEARFLTPGHVREVCKAQAQIQALGLELSAPEVCLKRRLMTREQIDMILGPQASSEDRRFGPYKVLAKIGEGGMGAVYKAVKDGATEFCALKILPKKFATDKELVARFQREAKIACGLQHPNLVRGLDHGLVSGRSFYAMEFVDGVLLSDVIEEHEVIAEKATLQIAIQMASALVKIDHHGMVHRDIKPDNIIIDRTGTAKLMDLGLIKSVLMNVTTLTKTGFTLGTPQYMSYEQILGSRDIDIRADVYSLGATIYHMVTGEAPFETIGVMELLQNFMKIKLVDPRAAQPELSDNFVRVLSRMLAKDRKHRYKRPENLLADLNRVHDGKDPKTRAMSVMTPPKRKKK